MILLTEKKFKEYIKIIDARAMVKNYYNKKCVIGKSMNSTGHCIICKCCLKEVQNAKDDN